jgi:hypothetical protein
MSGSHLELAAVLTLFVRHGSLRESSKTDFARLRAAEVRCHAQPERS